MGKQVYYRNREDLVLGQEFVDRHSLWELRGNVLVLVDSDRYVEQPLSGDFYPLPK